MQVGLLLVRMTVHNEVDASNFTRQSLADVLAGKSSRYRVVARGLIESGMDADDHHFCPRSFYFLHGSLHCRNDVGELHLSAHIGSVPDHHAGSRRAHDADFYSLPIDDRPRPELVRSVRFPCVSREHREARLRHRLLEVWDAIVVFVVAYGGGIVAHRVHRGDDRVGRIGELLHRHVRKRISLKQVASVDKDHAARIRRANRIDNGRGASQSADGLGGIGIIIPSAYATVNVRGAQYEKLKRRSGCACAGRIRSSRCASGDCCEQDRTGKGIHA